jgi:hypothetical protein
MRKVVTWTEIWPGGLITVERHFGVSVIRRLEDRGGRGSRHQDSGSLETINYFSGKDHGHVGGRGEVKRPMD